MVRGEPGGEAEAVQLTGHVDVGEYDVHLRAGSEHADAFRRIACLDDAITEHPEGLGGAKARPEIIFDQQDYRPSRRRCGDWGRFGTLLHVARRGSFSGLL